MKKYLTTMGLATLISLPLTHVTYADDWSGYADVSALTGAYTGATTKTAINGLGANLNLNYLEWGGVKLATSKYIIATTGSTIEQQSYFVSGYFNKYCDTVGGVFKFRFDAHQVDLKDEFTYADNVTAYAPQVSFLNYQKNFYADMGYTLSTYANGLEVQQLSPTIGFSFNGGANWLQTRGYFINLSDASLAQGVSNTQAVEVKLTHWTSPGSIFSSYFVNGLVGERAFAVDGDSASIYSLADSQQGGGAVGAAWSSKYVDGSLMFSVDSYLNNSTSAQYVNSLFYVSLSKSW